MAKKKKEVEEELVGSDHINEFGTPRFDVDSGYSSNYLKDIYESDDYFLIDEWYKKIRSILDDFIIKFPQYDRLRLIDVEKLKKGDKVNLIREKQPAILIDYSPPIVTVEVDSQIIEVKSYNVEPAPSENPIIKLKGHEIREMYCEMKNMTYTLKDDEIEYFYVFSEYFKINPKTIYNSLTSKHKMSISSELEKRTGRISRHQKESDNFEKY